jgi:RNA polymerase sigma factor (sigma-70 family)
VSAIAPLARGTRLSAVPRRLLRLRSDAALAERFAAGDEAAFAVLYERHRASVLAVCIGVLGSPHDAEDAAQEVFASLAVALQDHQPRELRPWLVRVARNAAIDVQRRRRSGSPGSEVADRRAATDSGIRAELESVLSAVRELPESQRTALLMRELAGHSYAEIAGLLGCDEEAVRGLIARARIGVRNYREAAELPCAAARQALAAEPDGRRQDKVVRRHVRRCPSCQAYRRALRADAKALHGLAPGPCGALAGGGALVGAAAKSVLAGGALTQAGAACAVSICSVGGMVLLAPHLVPHPAVKTRAGHHAGVDGRRRHERAGRGTAVAAVGASTGGSAVVVYRALTTGGAALGGDDGADGRAAAFRVDHALRSGGADGRRRDGGGRREVRPRHRGGHADRGGASGWAGRGGGGRGGRSGGSGGSGSWTQGGGRAGGGGRGGSGDGGGFGGGAGGSDGRGSGGTGGTGGSGTGWQGATGSADRGGSFGSGGSGSGGSRSGSGGPVSGASGSGGPGAGGSTGSSAASDWVGQSGQGGGDGSGSSGAGSSAGSGGSGPGAGSAGAGWSPSGAGGPGSGGD